MATREHITLTASTAASVTVTAPADVTTNNSSVAIYVTETHRIHNYLGSVTVVNHSSTDTVYYRFDGSAPTDSGADDDWVLPPSSSYVHSPVRWDSKQFVLISTGTPTVSIIGD